MPRSEKDLEDAALWFRQARKGLPFAQRLIDTATEGEAVCADLSAFFKEFREGWDGVKTPLPTEAQYLKDLHHLSDRFGQVGKKLVAVSHHGPWRPKEVRVFQDLGEAFGDIAAFLLEGGEHPTVLQKCGQVHFFRHRGPHLVADHLEDQNMGTDAKDVRELGEAFRDQLHKILREGKGALMGSYLGRRGIRSGMNRARAGEDMLHPGR